MTRCKLFREIFFVINRNLIFKLNIFVEKFTVVLLQIRIRSEAARIRIRNDFFWIRILLYSLDPDPKHCLNVFSCEKATLRPRNKTLKNMLQMHIAIPARLIL
jgi:hypothetical protein